MILPGISSTSNQSSPPAASLLRDLRFCAMDMTLCSLSRRSRERMFPVEVTRTRIAFFMRICTLREISCACRGTWIEISRQYSRFHALRYTDTFVKVDGEWLFAERRLYVDWIEERPLS
jgi:hypothetical protein